MRCAFVSASLLLVTACGGEGFALTEVDGGFVLGADAADGSEGSSSSVEATCLGGSSGSACPPERPRCLPSASGGFACIAAGSVGTGAVCADSGVDDCELGAICVKSDEASGWRCRALCDVAHPCPDESCTPLGPRSVSACLPSP